MGAPQGPHEVLNLYSYPHPVSGATASSIRQIRGFLGSEFVFVIGIAAATNIIAAATAAAVTELPRVSPGIFPFNWSVFRRLEPRKSLPGGQYRKNGPSHQPTRDGYNGSIILKEREKEGDRDIEKEAPVD